MGFFDKLLSKENNKSEVSKDELDYLRDIAKQKREREVMMREKEALKREIEGPSFRERLGSGLRETVFTGSKVYSKISEAANKNRRESQARRFDQMKIRRSEIELGYKEERLRAMRQKNELQLQKSKPQSNPFESSFGGSGYLPKNPLVPEFDQKAIDSLVPKYKQFR